MAKYLSIDTETTGLELDCYLIQVAVLPVDSNATNINMNLGREILIGCPSFEELRPKLSAWVAEHNETLIRKAHAEGIAPDAFSPWLQNYLAEPVIKNFFSGERPIILGKSLSALDIPVLTRYLTKPVYEKLFHHHTVDITCIARALVDCGALPKGCEGTSKLVQQFKLQSEARHTAMSDAVDMAKIYQQLMTFLKPLTVK